MALIKCPECQNSISSLSEKCNYCGLPKEYYSINDSKADTELLEQKTITSIPKKEKSVKKANRHMRLPNGFGSIRKLSGNRRKPYGAYAPIKGYKLNGTANTPKSIGFFETYQEAYKCLLDYNDNPFLPTDANLTFAKAYERYKNSKAYDVLKEKSKISRESAYKHCEPIHDMPVREITKPMCQEILDSIDKGSATKKNVLTCMRTVSDMAMDLNLIKKDFTQGIEVIVGEESKMNREVFKQEEIEYLWSHSNEWDYAVLLILIYTGLRVNELLKNTRDNLHLEERYIHVPKELAKTTESERDVPIHKMIVPLFKMFMDNSKGKSNLMCNSNGTVITYQNFVARNLKKINEEMKTDHKFHDTRHTFATQCMKLELSEVHVQKILGHSASSMLRSTYTHLDINDLITVIDCFTY